MTDARSPDASLAALRQMLARGRLSIDRAGDGRTSFFSHLGAQERLVPGPWIAHRELLYALALANLSPEQRTSLARAVLADYGHEFGVGQLVLRLLPSGLPCGGSSLLVRSRSRGGPVCLYAWGLGPGAEPAPCDWLLLRAERRWALDEPPRVVEASGLAKLVALSAEILVLVPDQTSAISLGRAAMREAAFAGSASGALPGPGAAEGLAGATGFAAHPRFAPHLDGTNQHAAAILWPHDALGAAGLRGRNATVVVLVDAPLAVRQEADAWAARRTPRPEIVLASGPGGLDRSGVTAFWQACGRPRVLLRGDSEAVAEGAAWLGSLGAFVETEGVPTQLGLFGRPG